MSPSLNYGGKFKNRYTLLDKEELSPSLNFGGKFKILKTSPDE